MNSTLPQHLITYQSLNQITSDPKYCCHFSNSTLISLLADPVVEMARQVAGLHGRAPEAVKSFTPSRLRRLRSGEATAEVVSSKATEEEVNEILEVTADKNSIQGQKREGFPEIRVVQVIMHQFHSVPKIMTFNGL